jgi:hypothetical protein
MLCKREDSEDATQEILMRSSTRLGRTITLEQAIDALVNMDKFEVAGVTVVTEF